MNEAANALGTTRHRLRCGINAGRYPCIRWESRILVDLDVVEPLVRADQARRETWVGIGEISRITGLSIGTLRHMCRDGAIPYRRDKQGRYQFQVTMVVSSLSNMMK